MPDCGLSVLRVSINSNSQAPPLSHTAPLPPLITGSIYLIFKDCTQKILFPFLSACNVKQQHIFTSLHTNITRLLCFPSRKNKVSETAEHKAKKAMTSNTSVLLKSGIPLEWELNNRADLTFHQDLFLFRIPEL